MYFAHSVEGKSEEHWQPLDEHLLNTSQLAGEMASVFGAETLGRVAGLLHDNGKATSGFQKRLRGSMVKVDHSTAGGQAAISRFGKVFGRLLAYTIIGHHSGLPNGGSSAALGCLVERLNRNLTEAPELSDRIIKELTSQIVYPFNDQFAAGGFSVAFLVRMVYSALVDADSLDTEQFCSPDKSLLRGFSTGMLELSALLADKLSKRFANPPDTRINRHRADILSKCSEAGSLPRGILTLTVPTGGGKTFASVSFALNHASLHEGMRRVIYAIPFTSIIEQNAAQFKELLGEENVLEHHSNSDFGGGDEVEDNQTLKKMRLSAENWDAPVIVTTNVQFFESLFSNRRSRCRKLHNIAGSVIILDEAQMLDVDFLAPSIAALEELVRHYNCTVVLCTATQPALGRYFSADLKPVEIIVHPRELYEAFRKVTVSHDGTVTQEELAVRLQKERQVLCIVNTRGNAAELYKLIKDAGGAYHLSARMTATHRSRKIAQIKAALKAGETCRVVSTQLIEAGVDLDFPVVYRAMAGIDSIVQAAGRCNREGRRPEGGQVHIFSLDGQRLMGWFSKTAAYGREIMELFPDDPLSPEAVGKYFTSLYCLEQSGLDRQGILKAFNEGDGARDFLFPFKQIAEEFKLIEDNTFSIIIAHDEVSREMAARLKEGTATRSDARQLGRYTVQVYANELAELRLAGSVLEVDGSYILADLSLYDTGERGLLRTDESSYATDLLYH